MNSLFAYIGDKPCKTMLWQGLRRCTPGALTGWALQTENGIALLKSACPPNALPPTKATSGEDGPLGIAVTSDPQTVPLSDALMPPYTLNGNCLAPDSDIPPVEATALLDALSNRAELSWLQAMRKQLAPSQASVILFAGEEQCLYCRAAGSPLYIAIAEHGFFVTNELTALPEEAVRFHLIKTGESAKITRERATIFDARLRKIKKPLQTPEHRLRAQQTRLADSTPLSLPLSVKAVVSQCIADGILVKEAVCPLGRIRQRLGKVILIGSGEAYYAAKMAAPRFAALADLPATAYESSEPMLTEVPIEKGTLLIAIAAGGRDNDAARCLTRAGKLGAVTLAMTGNPCSQLALTAAYHLTMPPQNPLVNAYLVLTFTALYLGNRYEVISDVYLSVAVQLATTLAGKVGTAVRSVPPLQHLSGKINHAGSIVTAGIGADTVTADIAAALLRRSLQLPAYVQSLTMLADESPSFLRNTLVLAFITDSELTRKAMPPLYRLLHSEAEVIMITTESIAADLPEQLPVVAYPDSMPLFNPLICLSGFCKICASAKELPETEAI